MIQESAFSDASSNAEAALAGSGAEIVAISRSSADSIRPSLQREEGDE
jgi:hypothetical protein